MSETRTDSSERKKGSKLSRARQLQPWTKNKPRIHSESSGMSLYSNFI